MKKWLMITALFSLLFSVSTRATVTQVEVKSRVVIPAYQGIQATERLSGTVHFSFQQSNPYNKQIVDLDKAPINQGQLVSASADFMVIQPLNPANRSGIGLLEVSSNGDKSLMQYFNFAPDKAKPVAPTDLGDGLLQQQGMTLIWLGWQHDLIPADEKLNAELPQALSTHKITGLKTKDWVLTQPAKRLPLAEEGAKNLYPIDRSRITNVLLTKRKTAHGMRQLVDSASYQFTSSDVVANHSFDPGFIYELTYPVKTPYIAGLSMAMIRDLMAYAKYNKQSRFKVDKGIAFGAEQGGRLLRQFIYQGFNVAEDGRSVFDGMMIHGAGAGKGSFNHRFATPGEEAGQYSNFSAPTDLFPFSSQPQKHPISQRQDSLYQQLATNHQPKIFYTSTGYDYWHRAAALTHSQLDKVKDLNLNDNERYYHFAGTQQYPMESTRLTKQAEGYKGNPLEYRYYLRGLLHSMKAWVLTNKSPLDSVYPKYSDGTLTQVSNYQLSKQLNGAQPHSVFLSDYGQRWSDGIADIQPPRLLAHYTPAVPQVDEHGNESGGIKHPLLLAPIASLIPWSMENKGFDGQMSNKLGSTKPFDSDLLYQLYRNKDDFLKRVKHAANNQANLGYMLTEDVTHLVRDADIFWDWVKANN